MNNSRRIAVGVACVTLLLSGAWCRTAKAEEHLKLWYKQPAEKWEQALPLGNGRLGAMVFGTVDTERFQMNEESLWAGEPFDVYPDNYAENLKALQQLVLKGKIAEARALGLEKLTKSPTSYQSADELLACGSVQPV